MVEARLMTKHLRRVIYRLVTSILFKASHCSYNLGHGTFKLYMCSCW